MLSAIATLPDRLDPASELESWGRTEVGRVRPSNQDQFLIASLARRSIVRGASLGPGYLPGRTSERLQGHVLAVADGVGSGEHGDLASAVTIDDVADYLLQTMAWIPRRPTPVSARSTLTPAVMRADDRVRRIAARQTTQDTMATTFTMAYVAGSVVRLAHVGDSRCYQLHAGELRQLTQDHTLAASIRANDSNPDSLLLAPGFDHVLVNAVGGGTDSGLWVERTTVTLAPADLLLLCTDGLTRHLDNDEIAERVRSTESVEAIVDDLVDTALARGGRDNVTVVAARVVA